MSLKAAPKTGNALFGGAFCARGMSEGYTRRTLSTNQHDTKTTQNANTSWQLPALSFARDDASMLDVLRP
jgi:hypothetical protein